MKYGMLEFADSLPDLSKKILHVDMDAFYASIEILKRPELKHKPVVIAKHPNLTGGRGIVSTCNYVARQYGIHSAMPAIEAYRRCPRAIFIKGDMSTYRQVSQNIRQIFYRYTDLVQPVSLDEAYLDISQNHFNCPSATLIGQAIQQEIRRETGLTCSVGISYNKFLAKVASDFQKPFGLTVIEPEQAHVFLMKLPIEHFHGVGTKTQFLLKEMNVADGFDLYQLSLEELEKHFGKAGLSLYYKVRGIASNRVEASRLRKSLGKERTFLNFLTAEEQVMASLTELSQEVGGHLIKESLKAYTVTLKVRTADFQTVTRQHSLTQPIKNDQQILENVIELWRSLNLLGEKIRLLGVTVSNFDRSLEQECLLNI